jgi:hypothetical protein
MKSPHRRDARGAGNGETAAVYHQDVGAYRPHTNSAAPGAEPGSESAGTHAVHIASGQGPTTQPRSSTQGVCSTRQRA